MVDKVSFLGCGSWGAALGSILVDKGVQVNFWHRDSHIIEKNDQIPDALSVAIS